MRFSSYLTSGILLLLCCSFDANGAEGQTMGKQDENIKIEHLPQKPSTAELMEIGMAILFTLEKSQDKDVLALIPTLNAPDFKPYTIQHYIADWYLDGDGNTLSCGRLLSDSMRLQFRIQLVKNDDVWQSLATVSKSIVHKYR